MSKHPGGAPTKYRPIFIEKVDEYLEQSVDTYEDVVAQHGINNDKSFEKIEPKLKVELPTMEGFVSFLNKYIKTEEFQKDNPNYGPLGVRSLLDWRKHKEFSLSLDRIVEAQKKVLLNKGLSGEYNPTIAKLILSANHGMSEKTETDITSKGEKIELIEFVFPK